MRREIVAAARTGEHPHGVVMPARPAAVEIVHAVADHRAGRGREGRWPRRTRAHARSGLRAMSAVVAGDESEAVEDAGARQMRAARVPRNRWWRVQGVPGREPAARAAAPRVPPRPAAPPRWWRGHARAGRASAKSGRRLRTVATTTSIVPAIIGLVRVKRGGSRGRSCIAAGEQPSPGPRRRRRRAKDKSRSSQAAQVALKSKSVPSLSKTNAAGCRSSARGIDARQRLHRCVACLRRSRAGASLRTAPELSRLPASRDAMTPSRPVRADYRHFVTYPSQARQRRADVGAQRRCHECADQRGWHGRSARRRGPCRTAVAALEIVQAVADQAQASGAGGRSTAQNAERIRRGLSSGAAVVAGEDGRSGSASSGLLEVRAGPAILAGSWSLADLSVEHRLREVGRSGTASAALALTCVALDGPGEHAIFRSKRPRLVETRAPKTIAWLRAGRHRPCEPALSRLVLSKRSVSRSKRTARGPVVAVHRREASHENPASSRAESPTLQPDHGRAFKSTIGRPLSRRCRGSCRGPRPASGASGPVGRSPPGSARAPGPALRAGGRRRRRSRATIASAPSRKSSTKPRNSGSAARARSSPGARPLGREEAAERLGLAGQPDQRVLRRSRSPASCGHSALPAASRGSLNHSLTQFGLRSREVQRREITLQRERLHVGSGAGCGRRGDQPAPPARQAVLRLLRRGGRRERHPGAGDGAVRAARHGHARRDDARHGRLRRLRDPEGDARRPRTSR